MLGFLGGKIAKLFGDPMQASEKKGRMAQILSDSLSTPGFSEVLFYESYDEKTGIFQNGSSSGFVFELTPLVGGDPSTLIEEMRILTSDSLPVGSFLQTLLWSDHRLDPFLDRWSSSIEREEAKMVAKERVEFLLKDRDPKTFRILVSFSIAKTNSDEIERIRDLVEQTLGIFSSMRRIIPSDLISLVGALTGYPSSREVIEKPYKKTESISEQLSTGNWIEVEKDYLKFGRNGFEDHIFQSYSATDWPDTWNPLQVCEFIGSLERDNQQINWPFFISHTIHVSHQSKENKTYATRAHLVEKQGMIPFLRRQFPDLVEEFDECGAVRQLKTKGDRWIRTSIILGVWSPEDDSEVVDQRLSQIYRALKIRLTKNRWFHLPSFIASLPMGWGEYGTDLIRAGMTKKTLSYEAGAFMPLQAEWQGGLEQGMLLQGRRGQLLSWDPFGAKVGNFNTIVVGTSGSGKSVFLQDMLYNGFSRGKRVFIIEVGRSFLRLCNLLEGSHIAFDGSDICLNPWPLVARSENRSMMISLVEMVVCTMCLTKRTPTDWEMAKVSKCVNAVWLAKGEQASMDDVQNWFRENGITEFADTISIYCSGGKYGSYFSGDKVTDLSNPMVVIELEELGDKPQLRSVALQICMATIANEVFLGDRKQKSYICIDEAWDLLKDGQMGPFIEKLARRLRKYGGALITGTQSVGDFDDNPGAEAAYTNSAWKCFLLQDPKEIAVLSEKKAVSDGVIDAISSISKVSKDYREAVILGADGGYSISRLALDPFSRLLFSTDAKDFGDIDFYRRKGLSTEESVRKVLEDRAC